MSRPGLSFSSSQFCCLSSPSLPSYHPSWLTSAFLSPRHLHLMDKTKLRAIVYASPVSSRIGGLSTTHVMDSGLRKPGPGFSSLHSARNSWRHHLALRWPAKILWRVSCFAECGVILVLGLGLWGFSVLIGYVLAV